MNNEIWVVAEHFQGRLNDITFELLGKARELARALGGKVSVVLLGNKVRGLASELGAADKILLADRPELAEFTAEAYTLAIEAALKGAPPRLLLLGSTSVGLDLLGLLSTRLGFPCVDNCTRLLALDSRLVVTSQIYGGKIFAEVTLPEQTTLVAAVPGSFPVEAGKVAGNAEVVTLELPPDLAAVRTAFRKWIEPPPGDVDITKIPVLVAVGRGIQNADNVPQAEELAQILNGAVCGSRPVIDQGWLPKTRQVGKSGMTVKPKLYLALGVSGAPEHVEGMHGGELIVAINTDPRAPIFTVAHYGAVADLFDVLPSLIEEIKTRQSSRAA